MEGSPSPVVVKDSGMVADSSEDVSFTGSLFASDVVLSSSAIAFDDNASAFDVRPAAVKSLVKPAKENVVPQSPSASSADVTVEEKPAQTSGNEQTKPADAAVDDLFAGDSGSADYFYRELCYRI